MGVRCTNKGNEGKHQNIKYKRKAVKTEIRIRESEIRMEAFGGGLGGGGRGDLILCHLLCVYFLSPNMIKIERKFSKETFLSIRGKGNSPLSPDVIF